MNWTRKSALALGAMALAWCPAGAQQTSKQAVERDDGLKSQEELNLRTLACWDLVTMAEDDRGYALTLLYGFALRGMDKAKTSPRQIQLAAVATIQECLDKPDANALSVLKSHVSALTEDD